MRIYFSTVNRNAPLARGGELAVLDLAKKKVEARTPIVPSDPSIDDPNPRGNTRGGRGILVLPDRAEICVASYHTLLFFDRSLRPLRRISHPMMASLHEIVRTGERSLLASSTAVDAALEIDLLDGRLLAAYHPREMPDIQKSLSLSPLSIDKDADNRTRFLGSEHFTHPHHLHLNAVAVHRGEILALFSKQGCIANLTRDVILIRDNALNGSHNLLVVDDRAYVNHTVGRGVLVFDLGSRKRVRHVGYGNDPRVKSLVRFAMPWFQLRKKLEKMNLLPARASMPLFARGLARHAGKLYVGISPATILVIDEATAELVDLFTDTRDVDSCVHGLEVDPAAAVE